MGFQDLMDGRYLDRVTSAEDQDNQAWLRQRMGTANPQPMAQPHTPEDVDNWWDEFLKTTAADVGKVLLNGVTFGIVQPKHLGTLGTIIEKYATPEDRKGAIRKVAEFGGELLSGAVVGGPILGPVGRAAAGILPKAAGAVARGAVRAGAEGAAIGAAQAGADLYRGEATPMGVAMQIGGGAVLGGAFGGAMGKLTSLMEKRARAKIESMLGEKLRAEAEAKQAATRKATEAELGEKARTEAGAPPSIAQRQTAVETAGREAVLDEVAAVDQYEAELIKWAKQLEVVESRRTPRVSPDAESTSGRPTLGQPKEAGPSVVGQTPITVNELGQANVGGAIPIAEPRTPIGALPAPKPPAETVDPRLLLKKADAIEASLEGKSERYKAIMREQINSLRQQAMAAQATDVAVETVQEITARKEWPKWRQALLKGGQTGNVDTNFAVALGQAALGAIAGGTAGAAMTEKPEDRLQNMIAGALVGGVAAPALLKLASNLLMPKLGALTEAATKAKIPVEPMPTAVGEVAPTPRPAAKIRIEPLGTPEAEKLIADLGGQTQKAGGFVFHVPWAERATREDLAQSVQSLMRQLESRVGSARIGSVSEEVLNEVAKKFDLGDLLSKTVGSGWNRFEATALGMHMRAADADFWRLLQAAKDDPTALNEFKKVGGVLLQLTRTLFGATSEWGYTGHAWQTVQEATPMAQNSVRMLTQLLGMDGAEAQLKLGVSPKRFHEMMLSMAEQKGKTDTMIGWATFAKQIENGLIEAWINGLLSNPATHAANILGNIGPVFAGPAERFLAAKFSTGSIGSVVPGEGTEMLFGLWSGFGDAFKAASKSFRTGVSAWDALATKIESPRKAIAAGPLGLSDEEVLGKGVNLLGEIIRTPGRALTAADDFFKMLNYRMEYHALTYRAAKIAHPEGGEAFTKALAALRADPTTEILEQAVKFSEVQTFTNPLGDFGNALQRLSNSHPSVKLILPFVRTPINLFKYAWERTPGLNFLNSQVRADYMAGGAARDLVVAKMALGGMVAGTAAVLAAGGVLSGKGPSDKALLEELQMTGWQPYSAKIGDTYYAFSRLDPIGMTLGAIADFADLSGHMDEATTTNVAQAIVLSMIRNVTSKTWMQGVANVLEALTDQDGRYLSSFFNLQARSIVPAFMGQVTRSYVDPEIHEVHSVLDAVRSRTPGFSKDLPPRRNLWGEAIQLEGGLGPDIASPIYTRKVAGDKVAEELSANRIAVSLPPDFIYGTHPPEGITAEQRVSQGVPLTAQQRDKWIQLMGKGVRDGNGRTIKEAMQALIASPEYRQASGGPDGLKAVYVQRIVNGFREQSRQQLLQDDPELMHRVMLKQTARQMALTGGM